MVNNIQELNSYFSGKICTIFTKTINRSFNEKQAVDYFVGIVNFINELGILMTHPGTGCKSFYFMSNICSIAEEIIEKGPEEVKSSSPYMDIDALTKLSKLSH